VSGLVSKQSRFGLRGVRTAGDRTRESRGGETGVSGGEMSLKQLVTASDVQTALDTAWYAGLGVLAQMMTGEVVVSRRPVAALLTLEYWYTAGMKLEMFLHLTFTF